MAKSKGKGTDKLNIDFSNTDEGGSRIPAGEYVFKITKAEVKDGENHPYIQWTLEVVAGEFKGKEISHFTTLAPHALWNLRNLLVAIGVSVPKGSLSLKLKEYIGKIFGAYVEEGEYKKDGKKKKKTELVEVYAVEKQGKKWVKVVDDEDDDSDEDDDDDSDDDDDDDDSDDDDGDDDDSDDDDGDDDDDDSDSDDDDDDSDGDSDDDDDDDDDSDDDDDDDSDDDDDLDEELEEIINKGKKGKGAPAPKKEAAAKGKGKKEPEPEPVKKGKGKKEEEAPAKKGKKK